MKKCKNGVCREWHRVFGWVSVERESEESQKVRGKTEKVLKNLLWNAKHAFFATGVSHQQVARASRQNTQSQNYEKNF